MQIFLTMYLSDNCSETSVAISAVAPVRTGLQFMINAFILSFAIFFYPSITPHMSFDISLRTAFYPQCNCLAFWRTWFQAFQPLKSEATFWLLRLDPADSEMDLFSYQYNALTHYFYKTEFD